MISFYAHAYSTAHAFCDQRCGELALSNRHARFTFLSLPGTELHYENFMHRLAAIYKSTYIIKNA